MRNSRRILTKDVYFRHISHNGNRKYFWWQQYRQRAAEDGTIIPFPLSQNSAIAMWHIVLQYCLSWNFDKKELCRICSRRSRGPGEDMSKDKSCSPKAKRTSNTICHNAIAWTSVDSELSRPIILAHISPNLHESEEHVPGSWDIRSP